MPQKITLESIHDLLSDYTVMSDQKFTNVENELKNMKENHIAHLAQATKELKVLQTKVIDEIAEVQVAIPAIINDVSWLKKIQWAVLISVIGTMLTVIAQIYINSINN